ncbi:MAG TPA: phage holin family protein [Bacteroidales bacterium]|nr:phage holin family protein [Bacteroidales bacterium]
MEEKSSFETLLERAEDYTRTSIELIKLKAVDKISDGASSAASKIVAMFFFFFFFLMLSVGLSLWIGDLLGKIWYGFMVIAGLYGILWAVLFFVRHNWLKKMVGNSIIKQMLN